MTEPNKRVKIEPQDHHKKSEKCKTRPAYRESKNLTGVKVYTLNDESQHILIFNVPSLKLNRELRKICSRYGAVKSMEVVSDYPNLEPFTELYHVLYERVSSARYAKKNLNNHSFYGSILFVCYAPELESIEDTKKKFFERKRAVSSLLRRLKFEEQEETYSTTLQ